jgi:CO/xanthine dehydrogenase Mo-binding subunit
MAAIANAIDSAIHRRLTELPMSPPKIVAALEAGRTDD